MPAIVVMVYSVTPEVGTTVGLAVVGIIVGLAVVGIRVGLAVVGTTVGTDVTVELEEE